MNSLRKRLALGERLTMVHLAFNSPNLVEYLAELHFDAVMIDCEHTSASVERVEEMVRAARASGIAALVRPESATPEILTRYIDCKADGLVIPHVESVQDAQAIVDAVRYARPRDHDKLLLVAMLESVRALEALESICTVDGIDVYFLARVDLSKSMGLGGDKTHPRVRAEIDRAITRIRAAGRHAGAAGDMNGVIEVAGLGAQLIFVTAKALLQFGAEQYLSRLQSAAPAASPPAAPAP